MTSSRVSAATERKAMPGNRLAHPSPVPADREPVDGHAWSGLCYTCSWADHERAAKINPFPSPHNGARPTGCEGGGRDFWDGRGGESQGGGGCGEQDDDKCLNEQILHCIILSPVKKIKYVATVSGNILSLSFSSALFCRVFSNLGDYWQ